MTAEDAEGRRDERILARCRAIMPDRANDAWIRGMAPVRMGSTAHGRWVMGRLDRLSVLVAVGLAAQISMASSRAQDGAEQKLAPTAPVTSLGTSPVTTLTKWIKDPWTPDSLKVFRMPGSSLEVKALKTVYVTEDCEHLPVVIPVVAFADSETHRAWVVPTADFYVLTEKGVVCGTLMWGGDLFFDKDLVADALGDTQGAIDRFDRELDGAKITAPPSHDQYLGIHGFLSTYFFCAHPGSSQSGKATITNMELVDGVLRLDLRSPAGDFDATVSVDVERRTVVKASENGKQVFPK
jgi:hypothetical protein